MSIRSLEARGEQRRCFARAKAAYATTAPAFASANTLRVKEMKLDFKEEHAAREDNRQTLDAYDVIPGMRSGTWTITMELQGSGALGTAWSCSPFLAAAFGTETINASTSVVYTFDDTQGGLGWLDFLMEMNAVLSIEGRNAWQDKLTIGWKGKSVHTITMSGGFSDWILTGSATLDGPYLTNDTTVGVVAGQELRFQVGSRTIIGTSNPTSTGHTVGAVDDGNDEIDFTPGLASNQDAVDVVPWFPAEAAPPSVISGVLGAVDIDGSAYVITEGELSVELSLEPRDDEAFTPVVTDYGRGWRKTTGKVKFRAYRDQIVVLQQRNDPAARSALNFELGATAGSIMEIDLPQVKYEFAAIDTPAQGSAMVELPFLAMSSDSVTSDAASITLR